MKTKKKKKENMGQKVGGYRRNERYGTKTVRIPLDKGEEGRSWRFEVNPKGRVGWDRGNVRRNETGYGSSLSQGRRRRDQVEELRKGYGCTTNGVGRKGDGERGYTVYGEYTYRDYEKKEGRRESDPQVDRKGSEGKEVGREGGKKKEEKKGSSPLAWTKEMEGRKAFRSQEEFKKERKVGRRRLKRKREKERGVKVERKREDLKERREGNSGRRKEKEERKARLGRQSKRTKPDERVDGAVRSGTRPMIGRRSKLIAKELESGRKHRQSMREIEKVRKAKSKNGKTGRKREKAGGEKGGYYGYQVQRKGPLGGARRTMVRTRQEGTVPRGTKEARRRTGKEHAKTSIGTIGVKVSYCYGLG